MDLIKAEIAAKNGMPIRLIYDNEGDILDIFFGENEASTGVELTDHIIFRVSLQSKRAVSLTLLDFSVLAEKTEFGPRSFALNLLDDLPDSLRDLIWRLITSLPVSQFIKVFQFQSPSFERLPLAFVESRPELLAA